MAGTGMALRRGTNHGPSEAGDDVQSSIELLDRVLSEFDDMENANQVQNQIVGPTPVPLSTNNISTNTTPGNVSSTPEDESPSLGGHQSEDDGYMSMNGRKARFALSFRPLTEVTVHQENIMEQGVNVNTSVNTEDFPPPPEEAERLIATLLPRVSTTNLSKRNNSRRSRVHHGGQPAIEVLERNIRTADIDHFSNGKIIPIHTATQTTFPKTRHQRPYGWENQDQSNFRLHPAPVPPGQRYGSLPISHGIPPILSPQRMPMRTPPRTVPTSAERHREVRRRESEDNLSSDVDDVETGAVRPSEDLADDERFSDDSLEEMLLPPPPPPVPNKRESIAWEVSLDNEEELLTPGSTKVVGRRRRRSGEHSHSSTSSIPNRLKDLDDWPEPPPCSTEDEVVSPFSDSDDPIILPEELRTTDLNGSGTYIIRRGRSRKPVPNISDSNNSNSSLNSRLSSDLSLLQSRLNTPNSRYSIDLSTPHSRLSQELISPKSRCSLDLNKLSEELISPSKINVDFSPRYNAPQCRSSDFKKHSTTFDNIKSFMRESIVTRYDPCNEVTTDFSTSSPTIVRVVSLPTLSGDEYTPSRRELTVTVEEEEDVESPRQNSAEISPLRKIEKNISQLLEREDIDISSLDLNNKTHNNTHLNSPNAQIRASKRNGIQKSESAKEMLLSHLERPERPLPNSTSADFPVKVDIVQHEFPPLPPSPVVEDDDEYSEILHSVHIKKRADTLPVMPVPDTHHRSDEPPAVPPHRGESFNNSLKTRSMDGGIGRGKRNNILSSSSRMSSSERRTLPTDLPGTKRRTFNSKRSCQSPREESHMQTSCSLPETPIFARGCDIPRTPHRRAPEVPPHRTTPRQTATMSNLNSLPTGSSYRRGFSNSNLEQALVGAEMLRLAGGPGRGWYPRHRQPRPASIEHLDRLTPSHSTWDAGSRKPLTLPPNLTPKFFHRSPREALRRVTSLLIRKGNNGKEPKKEKEQQATNNWANQEEGQKKKGFFKNLWKRSRHYSLEQQ